MTLSADGQVLFVGTREGGRVYALPDRGGDGRADEVITLAEGLDEPNGVAFRDGALYVAEARRILRYDDIERRLHAPPRPVVVLEGFPEQRDHAWKFIAFGPDGWLYVPVGAPCNICRPENPLQETIAQETITRLRADGTGPEVYAKGIRNSIDFD